MAVRFDDRLATALAQPADSPAARQALWRQIVDLLAQAQDDQGLRQTALHRLERWRKDVPPVVRQSMAIQLAIRRVPPDMLRFFAADTTAVAAPLLAGAQMAESEWEQLIPTLTPIARALLRHRRDLPGGALRALALFGRDDLVLEGSCAPVAAEPPSRSATNGAEVAQITAFDFRAGSGGTIEWTDLAVRGAMIGLSIAHAATAGGFGVDGQAAGAFRRRASFRDARLLVGGATPLSGDWSVSGAPSFDSATGRFTGYRGSARRPDPSERAEPPLGGDVTRDSLRQLSHELRTPLNAIGGFAQMIEQQMLGPIEQPYRARAATILDDTRRIEAVLDDLDEAAQVDALANAQAPQPVDCAMLMTGLMSALQPGAFARGVLVALTIAPGCDKALVAPASAELMGRRLLTSALGFAEAGERIDVAVKPGDCAAPETWITVTRPQLLRELDDARLLDACDVDGEDGDAAPALGLGFTMRLIRSISEGCKGALTFEPDCFRLSLPAASADGGAGAIVAGEPTGFDARSLAEWVERNATVACQGDGRSAIAPRPGGACSSMVELAAHNGLVGGSNPSGPTAQPPCL